MYDIQFYMNCVHFLVNWVIIETWCYFCKTEVWWRAHCYTLGLYFGIPTVAHDDTINCLTLQTVPSSGSNIIVSYALFVTAFQLSCCDVM